MRDALARRARLVPLLYTALHAFEASGVSALHPVYYGARGPPPRGGGGGGGAPLARPL
jgi:hypothetical protein